MHDSAKTFDYFFNNKSKLFFDKSIYFNNFDKFVFRYFLASLKDTVYNLYLFIIIILYHIQKFYSNLIKFNIFHFFISKIMQNFFLFMIEIIILYIQIYLI